MGAATPPLVSHIFSSSTEITRIGFRSLSAHVFIRSKKYINRQQPD